MTFTNTTAHNYVFSGTGGIAGTSTLTLNGTGSVTFQNANTYSGNTTVNSGTLILGTGGSIASPNLNVAGGIVNINSGGSASSTNVNVTAGAFNINGGSLAASGVNVSIASGATMSVGAGSTLAANANITDNGTDHVQQPRPRAWPRSAEPVSQSLTGKI